jgi:hypothetical protein
MITTVYKPFSFVVSLPNKTYTANFEFDKNIVGVKGFIIGTFRPDLAYFRGSQRIEISKIELFPENFLTQWLMIGINAPMNDRFKVLKDVLIGNRNIRIDYKDADDGRTPFAPYTYHIAFECDLDDTI